MAHRLTGLTVEFVSLVDRAAVRDPSNPTQPQRFLLTKGEIPVWKRKDTNPPDPTGGSRMNPEETAALKKAQDDLAAAQEMLAKSETSQAALTARLDALEKANKPADPKPEPKTDPAPPDPAAVAKAEQEVAERIQKAETRAQAAEDVAKAERDMRVTGVFIAKAEGLGQLTQDPVVFGPVLKAASEKLTKDEFGELDRVLKAANEQMRSSMVLLKELGDGRQPEYTDAETGIEKKADDIQKSDPSVSRYEAMARAARGDAGRSYLDGVR